MSNRHSFVNIFKTFAFFLVVVSTALFNTPGHAQDTTCAQLMGPTIDLAWVKARMAHDEKLSPEEKLLRQSVQNGGLRNASLNRDIMRDHNENYTVTLSEGTPTNQFDSPRCWDFAALNTVRSVLIGDGLVDKNFEFSQTYIYFYHMLEQSNSFLEDSVTDSQQYNSKKVIQQKALDRLKSFSGGGYYESFAFLATKYGLVPKGTMQESVSSENTDAMEGELTNYLAASTVELKNLVSELKKQGVDIKTPAGEAKLRILKQEKMNGIWNILATHLGTPPSEFEFRVNDKPATQNGKTVVTTEVKKFTPLTFASDFVHYNPRDYVAVVDSPFDKVGEVYEVEDSAVGVSNDGEPKFNIRFLNAKTEDMENLVMKSIDGGQPVWFASDVGEDFDPVTGILHPDIFQHSGLYGHQGKEAPHKMTRQEMIKMQLLAPNHAMSFIGYDRPVPTAPPVKFLDENSWGPRPAVQDKPAPTNGNLHVYREWFDKNVFVIIVHKKFLDPALQKKWAGQAKMITRSVFLGD